MSIYFGWGKKLENWGKIKKNTSSPASSYVAQNDNQKTYVDFLTSLRMFSFVRPLSKVE